MGAFDSASQEIAAHQPRGLRDARAVETGVSVMLYQAAKKATDKDPAGLERVNSLSLAFGLCASVRAEVIITHTPITPDACETHAQLVKKPIASLALRLC